MIVIGSPNLSLQRVQLFGCTSVDEKGDSPVIGLALTAGMSR